MKRNHKSFYEGSSLVSVLWLSFAVATLAGCGGIMLTQNSDPPPGTGSISGTVMDDSTNQPVGGAIVLLEQLDTGGIDRVINAATTASDGSFAFSALPSGIYDVVAAASVPSGDQATSTYAATVTFRVPLGATVNKIPLVPEFGNSMPNGQPADIAGHVTTSGGGPAQVDVKLSALQQAAPQGGSPVEVTIPTFTGSTPDITTTVSPTCPAGTACVNYVLAVPSSDPVVGTFNSSGTTYTIPASGPVEVIYLIEGRAFIHGSNGTPTCMPSSETAGPVVPRGTLPSRIPNLAFQGCQ